MPGWGGDDTAVSACVRVPTFLVRVPNVGSVIRGTALFRVP